MWGYPFASFTPRIRSRAWLVAGLGLVLLVGSAVTYFLDEARLVETQIGAGLGGLFVLGAVLLRPDTVYRAVTGRQVKYGSHAVVMSLAFIGILGVINFLSYKNNYEFDLTETGKFTLSEQTIRVLQNLDRPVQIIGFFQAGDSRLGRVQEYLERYSQYSAYLSYEFHDPKIEPGLARRFGVGGYGLVYLSGNNQYQSAGIDEQSLTSGLIRVTRAKERKLYFVTGHGEHNLDDDSAGGYSTLKQALERENYILGRLNLANGQAIPPDATALVIAGPGRELSPAEATAISGWVNAGGKLMLMVDPLQPPPLEQLLQTYGLRLGNDFVIEDYNHSLVVLGPDGLTSQVLAPMVVKYPYHEITHNLNGYRTFFPFVRSITLAPEVKGAKSVSAILATSPASWAETDFSTAEHRYTEGVDTPGPVYIGAAAEDTATGARLVVFGNAGFVANQNLSPHVANLDLFMNAVNWLTEEDELISIRPKQPGDHRLYLTAFQMNLTLFTTVIAIPLVVFLTGVGVWWKRR